LKIESQKTKEDTILFTDRYLLIVYDTVRKKVMLKLFTGLQGMEKYVKNTAPHSLRFDKGWYLLTCYRITNSAVYEYAAISNSSIDTMEFKIEGSDFKLLGEYNPNYTKYLLHVIVKEKSNLYCKKWLEDKIDSALENLDTAPKPDKIRPLIIMINYNGVFVTDVEGDAHKIEITANPNDQDDISQSSSKLLRYSKWF
jgi:hypothetical protein